MQKINNESITAAANCDRDHSFTYSSFFIPTQSSTQEAVPNSHPVQKEQILLITTKSHMDIPSVIEKEEKEEGKERSSKQS